MEPSPNFVHPGARRMFGVKDLVTSLNVLGGIMGIYFCIRGDRLAASYAVMLGFLADTVDGTIARALRESNRFGAEYDSLADHLAQSVAPAFVIYLYYRDSAAALGITPQQAGALGMVLAAAIILVASIRHARNLVRRVDIDFAWIGLPRSVAAFIVMGFANSALFVQAPGGPWAGVVMVPILCWLQLTDVPFKNHHGTRKNFWYVRTLVVGYLTTTVAAFVWAPTFAWDVLFFWTAGYLGSSWMAMTPDERRLVRQRVAEAMARLRAEEIAQHQARLKKS